MDNNVFIAKNMKTNILKDSENKYRKKINYKNKDFFPSQLNKSARKLCSCVPIPKGGCLKGTLLGSF